MIQTGLQPLEILHALGIDDATTITPLQGGYDMAMWKVEYQDQTYALRVFRVGAHEDCAHERVVMQAAHAAGLPVPEVHVAGVWQDHPALLITWMRGRMVTDELRTRPWRIWRLGLAFGRMQAAIHAIPAPDLLLQQPDAWLDWGKEVGPVLQERLRRLASKPTLLHLDYHPNNVLTDGKRITAVLDWTNALAGDPRADAARTVSILRVDPLARKPLIQWLALRVFEWAWRVGYQRAGGHLPDMAPFYAWAGTVMLRDQAYRYKDRLHELAPARRWTAKWKARGETTC